MNNKNIGSRGHCSSSIRSVGLDMYCKAHTDLLFIKFPRLQKPVHLPVIHFIVDAPTCLFFQALDRSLSPFTLPVGADAVLATNKRSMPFECNDAVNKLP